MTDISKNVGLVQRSPTYEQLIVRHQNKSHTETDINFRQKLIGVEIFSAVTSLQKFGN